MARLSIIIPVLGSTSRLETTLVSVLENRPADCEIIVVVNAPYADPYDLAGEVRFLQVPDTMGLIESMNEGIQASRAAVVHFLASGLEVADGWTDAAMPHFKHPRVGSVSPLVADVLDRRKILAAGLDYSCRRGRLIRTATNESDTASQSVEIVGPLAQAAFYRRSALELAGGFARAVGDSTADADLALTLRYAGYRSMLEPRSIVFATPGDIGPAPAGFKSGLSAERLFWRTAPVVGWKKSLAAHPLGVLGEFMAALPRAGAFTRLLGRFLGACQMRRYRAHHQWLADVERAASALFRGSRADHLRIDGPHDKWETARANDPCLSRPAVVRADARAG